MSGGVLEMLPGAQSPVHRRGAVLSPSVLPGSVEVPLEG